ncbi:MAG: YraN family protein [Proteobacteria bacterium]|nr:YraN family protein [Pseudomonadota bacterium]MBU1058049.1 YraN family protein [Pseudomonadota bacterium]
MSEARITLGKQGEDLAAHHLIKLGFSILARNYRQKIGEIDIIARDGNCLVFVEVKTRKTLRFGQPFEAVTTKKQAQLTRVALDYLNRNKLLDQPARFDVISILLPDKGKVAIEHIPNCFESVSGW